MFAQERQLHVLAQLGCRFFGHLLDVQDVLLVQRETGHCLEVILDLALRICSEVGSGQVFELHVFSQEMSQHVAYISFHHARYVGVATYIVLSPYLVWWNTM